MAILAAACATGDDRGAPGRSPKVIDWVATAENQRPAPDGGTLVDVTLSATVGPGWNVYSLDQGAGGPVAMSVKLGSLSPYKLAGDIQRPPVRKSMDPNFGIETQTYSGSPVFRLTLRRADSGDTRTPVELLVTSQACSDKICLPQRTDTVTVRFNP